MLFRSWAGPLDEQMGAKLIADLQTLVATRIFQFLFMEDGNKVYFCTESDKPVYRQLTANPKVSFCTSAKDWNPVLSLDGGAVFVDDMALKRRTLEEYPLIRDIFKTADNPLFKLFYLEVQEAVFPFLRKGAQAAD